jgi:hypothetical protein
MKFVVPSEGLLPRCLLAVSVRTGPSSAIKPWLPQKNYESGYQPFLRSFINMGHKIMEAFRNNSIRGLLRSFPAENSLFQRTIPYFGKQFFQFHNSYKKGNLGEKDGIKKRNAADLFFIALQ